MKPAVTAGTMSLTALGLLCILRPAAAQNAVTYNFTGTITSVEDDQGWLNNTYAVNAPLSGTLRYFDAGYSTGTLFGNLATKIYDFRDQNPDLRVRAGEREFSYNKSQFTVSVTNDGSDSFYGTGDSVIVQTFPSSLPSFFIDPSTQTGFEDYYAYPFQQIRLEDSTGTAFSSSALPLGSLNLSAFANAVGQVGFFDGNAEFSEFASATFRINTLQAVPEPGTVTLLLGCGLSGAGVLLRRRRK